MKINFTNKIPTEDGMYLTKSADAYNEITFNHCYLKTIDGELHYASHKVQRKGEKRLWHKLDKIMKLNKKEPDSIWWSDKVEVTLNGQDCKD